MIERQIAEAESLVSKRPLTQDDYTGWRTHTSGVVELAFGSGRSEVAQFCSAASPTAVQWVCPGERELEEARCEKLKAQIVRLRAFVKILKDQAATSPPETEPATTKVSGTKVFLVHGRDPVRHEVARFIEKLKLDVTILDERPNQGRTLIKKFGDHAGETRFAVVLLTADDVGCLRADLVKKGSAEDKLAALRPRARQNVIFELGYFLAKLGEGNVCALCEDDIEIPSDFAGVTFIRLAGDWGLRLAKELKAAELPVNINDAIR